MKSNSSCCGGTSTSSCTSSIAELPRYYPRQLITPADLTLEQDYFRDRMRRHNRLLHGWGVVCGALVCPVTVTNSDGTTAYSPWVIQAQPGYVLGPYGDEIVLDCARTVDVRTQGVSGVTGQTCVDAPDPWCTEVFTPPATTNPTTYYIAVKYVQSMTRPVRVQPIGCGCDDSSCEYSRWHDGYQIGVLSTCPTCNACDTTVTPPAFQSLIAGDVPPCPDCTCGPWVCLAAVTVNADGTIAQIDNCSCRRMVISYSTYWWKCTGTLALSNVSNSPVSVTAGSTTPVALTVNGTNLEADAKATYSFGPGVTATVAPPASGQPTTGLSTVTLNVTAASNAAPGYRNLVVQNADCSTAMLPNVIQVAASTSSSAAPAPPTGVTAGTNTSATPKAARTVASRTARKAVDQG
jgi:hypothetical protein